MKTSKLFNMFYYNFFILIGLSLFLISCDQEDQKLISPYCTLEIKPDYASANFYNWIIITNDRGEILEFLEYGRKGGVFEFKNPKNNLSDEIGIYFLEIFKNDFHDIYRMNGFLNISSGEKFVLNNIQPDEETHLGFSYVKVSNFPFREKNAINYANNNTEGLTGSVKEYIDLKDDDSLIDTVLFSFTISQSSDTLLIGNSYLYNDPRYLKIEGVGPEENKHYDFFNDFTPYDEIVTLEIPENMNVETKTEAFRNDRLFRLSICSDKKTNFTQFGYINGFQTYRSILTLGNYKNFYGLKYFKIGSPIKPDEIKFMDSNFEIINSSIKNFEFQASRELDYRKSIWINESLSNSYITIFSKTISPFNQIKSFPNEILEIHPFLTLEGFQYEQSAFIDDKSNFGYKKYVEEEINPKLTPEHREYYVYRK